MQDYFVHESSYVDDGVTIGAGTKVWHFCHIQKGAVIGRNCSLGQNVNVANNVRIGDGVRIQNNVSIYEGVDTERERLCFDGRGTGQADRVGVRMRPSSGRFLRVRVREKVPAGRGEPRESRVMLF